MKLATMRDGSRDGQLVVVSRDLTQAHYASGVANSLQQVLEDWNFLAPELQGLYAELNAGRARHAFALDTAQCLSPLPRTHGWFVGCPYPSHLERCAREKAPAWRQEPGGAFLAPTATWDCAGVTDLDFSAGLAVITGDVPRGCAPEQAVERVRLFALALTLAQAGSGRACAGTFAPVAVTSDELGEAWRAAKAHLTVQVQLNGRKFGLCDTGADMAQDFGACIAQNAQAQGMSAGSIIGALPVSSADAARGFCSLRERRCTEAAQDGEAATPWLQVGDELRVQARSATGDAPLFGAIHLQLS